MLKKYSFLMVLILLVSCKKQVTETEETNPLKSELPVGFHAFYEQFHADSTFQLSHIVFPLKGEVTRIDSVNQVTADMAYTQDKWKLHRPFVNDGSYNREFVALGDIVIENIKDNMGLLNIERRWAKVGGDWNLIYYGSTEKSW